MRTLTTKTRIVTVIADFDNENQDHMLVPISSLNLHVMEDHGRKPPTTFYLLQDSVPLLSLLLALSSKALFMAWLTFHKHYWCNWYLINHHAWLDFEENNWHLINHHAWLLIIDDEENHENWRREPFMAWLTHRKDYWYDQHLIKRTNLENDWHIKIIGTINTSLSGLNSWLTHHKDYGYNQHPLWRLTLRMGGGEPDEESVRIRGTWDSFEAIFILLFKNMASQPWWAFGNGHVSFDIPYFCQC